MDDTTRDEYTPTTKQIEAAWVKVRHHDQVSVADALAEIRRALAGVRAEAWDEGLDAGRDRWMDNREFGNKPVNPYRLAPVSTPTESTETPDLLTTERQS